uniref:Uncharacterized protein n=1 Tax=Ascaris lumbricoides TaxID=6252 RepID=A0A0M3HRM2_ASCLU
MKRFYLDIGFLFLQIWCLFSTLAVINMQIGRLYFHNISLAVSSIRRHLRRY